MFKNEDFLYDISQRGFAILDSNLLEEVRQLQTYINKHFIISGNNFYYSLLSNTFEQNKILQNVFKKILNEFYETNFTDYRTISESFLVKPAKTPVELQLHQDWCYTDEKINPAYNIWIPLIDVNEENGALFFLSGSHLYFNNLRSATLPTARISMNNFSADEIETVSLKKGQVLLFHPAIFHGSHPNHAATNRVVVTATLLPKAAPFLFYRQKDGADEVAVYNIDDDTFFRELQSISIGGIPSGKETGHVSYKQPSIDASTLKEKLLSKNL